MNDLNKYIDRYRSIIYILIGLSVVIFISCVTAILILNSNLDNQIKLNRQKLERYDSIIHKSIEDLEPAN